MTPAIDLILFGDSASVKWPLGEVIPAKATPAALATTCRNRLGSSPAIAFLFWDAMLGNPDPEICARTLALPGDLWHAGLRLGTAGLPGAIDFVDPTWPLNRDPRSDIEATSWRLSLRATLIRTAVLKHVGLPRGEFLTIDGAGLEFGHRCVATGVLTRHLPGLVALISGRPIGIPFEDELRFLYYRYGRSHTAYAITRALKTGYVGPLAAFSAARRVFSAPAPIDPKPYPRDLPALDVKGARVTVLIPTLERYSYLRTVLNQLRTQTVKPLEIIVLDQTAPAGRDTGLASEFGDLPLKVVYLDEAGQCTSRNLGISKTRGDYIVFLDDDVEVNPDLIELHLRSLAHFGCEVSTGVAEEIGAGSLPYAFTFTRVSDVFPAGNSTVRRDVLRRCGLFDLAYDRGQCEDGDLGIRMYLSGALLVLNPSISVLHHHAPRGGLRKHNARVVTFASSRRSLTQRRIPAPTEIYLIRRYFTARQVREAMWIWIRSTFVIRGGIGRKAVKAALSLVLLPHTIWRCRCAERTAIGMFSRFPQIPSITETDVMERSLLSVMR